MATQTSLIRFTGRLGDLIGYYRNGQYFMRSMPVHVRQTKATCLAARRFGLASKMGALIRHAFADEMDVHCDSTHINRLTKTLIAGGNDINCLKDFRFNQHAGTANFLTASPICKPEGTVYIPAQVLPQKSITALEVKVIAVRIDTRAKQVTGSDAVMTIIDAGIPFSGVTLIVDPPGRGMLVMMLQIRGICRDMLCSDRRYMSADIIAVCQPQVKQMVNKPIHTHLSGSSHQKERRLAQVPGYASRLIVQRE